VARGFFLGGVSRLMASIPVVYLLFGFFVDFFPVAEAVDLEDLAILSLMVSLLSSLSTLVVVVVEFASFSLSLLVLSWLLSGD
jgi:hypothetical protein